MKKTFILSLAVIYLAKYCYSITNQQIIENCKSIKFLKQKVDLLRFQEIPQQ